MGFLISITISLLFFTACSTNRTISTSSPTVAEATATTAFTPEPSPTPLPPTPTPEPLAAFVNGEAITMVEFQAELERFEQAATITGTILASDTNTIVLDELIGQTLFAQAAAKDGFIVDDSMLQSRVDALQTQLGSAQALESWISSHGYSRDTFEKSLRRSVGAAWMRDKVINTVPETAEEVHGMQILLPTSTEAAEVYSSLQTGKDFRDVALTYDPLTGGDLGWFPRGYLGEPAIDEAIFALQPGQYSQVVETDIGYHILFVAERDVNHPLQPDAKRALQAVALQKWLSDQRDKSNIQVFLP